MSSLGAYRERLGMPSPLLLLFIYMGIIAAQTMWLMVTFEKFIGFVTLWGGRERESGRWRRWVKYEFCLASNEKCSWQHFDQLIRSNGTLGKWELVATRETCDELLLCLSDAANRNALFPLKRLYHLNAKLRAKNERETFCSEILRKSGSEMVDTRKLSFRWKWSREWATHDAGARR